MIITLKKDAPKTEVEKLIHTFENKGLSVTMIQGDNYNVFGLVGDTSKIDEKLVKAHPFVENVTRIAAPYKSKPPVSSGGHDRGCSRHQGWRE